MNLEILYEDSWVLAVNKPSGMATHPGAGIPDGTLFDRVREYLGRRATRNGFVASPAHRLDRATSGVVLVALRRPSMVALSRLFEEGRVLKRYLALVRGRPPQQDTIETPLPSLIDGREQSASTDYRVLKQFEGAALLECRPGTGRTHQIRRHLAEMGYPLGGDPRYGDAEFNKDLAAAGLSRLFLHAASIELPHPQTQQTLRVEARLPGELKAFVDKLGLQAAASMFRSQRE
jgi:23S rRNA pseudouridine955/2504/2580 synthase